MATVVLSIALVGLAVAALSLGAILGRNRATDESCHPDRNHRPTDGSDSVPPTCTGCSCRALDRRDRR